MPHKPGTHNDARVRAEADAVRTGIARRLEGLALLALLLVVAMRPLLMETYESAENPIARAVSLPGGLTPAATAWFDLTIWLAAAATALAGLLARRAWRWTGFEIGWLLMLAGAVASTFVASNKRLAINCSADWLTAGALAWTLANLARRRDCVALVLAALIASGATSAARCAMQVNVEFPDTWRQYRETRDQFWGRQGVALDDPRVELFERRMRANEATGFFALANSQGAWLTLAGFAGLSMVALRPRTRSRRMMLALPPSVLLASILLTGARGALGAGFGLLIGLVAAWWLQDWLRRRWRLWLLAGWVAVAVGAIAMVGHGRAHGGLPGSSLNFRWQYWQVTRAMIADHFWSGVGAGNFDRVYLGYKPITFPEEIKDPHNFVLSAAAQWGGLGLLGLLAAMIGASVTAARRWGCGDDPDGDPPRTVESGAIPPAWIAAVTAGFLAMRFLVQVDLLAGGTSARAMLVFDLFFYGVLWCAVFAGVCRLERTAPNGSEADGAYRLPLAAGVCAFLLANTIDLSLFEPGPLTAFAAMAGLLLAGAERRLPPSTRHARQVGPLAASLAGTALVGVCVLVPVGRSMHHLLMARATPMPAAIVHYEAAAAADPLDPTPLLELAVRCYRAGTTDALDRSVNAINEAIQRDPNRLLLYEYRMTFLEERYRTMGSAADLLGALGAGRRCVEMYPTSPDQHLEFADLLARANAEINSPQLRDEALEHYRAALELNDARPGTDEARRWSPKRVDEIRRRMSKLLPASRPMTSPAMNS